MERGGEGTLERLVGWCTAVLHSPVRWVLLREETIRPRLPFEKKIIVVERNALLQPAHDVVVPVDQSEFTRKKAGLSSLRRALTTYTLALQ